MRQRRAKDEEHRLMQYDQYLVKESKKQRGKWMKYFPQTQNVYVEVGCGKGQFITTLALENEENGFIAIEGHKTVLLRALEKIAAIKPELKNVAFIGEYIQDITEYFEEKEVSGVYLNFSDPWPKDRHAKRRLTHGRYLNSYKKILKPGGFIALKTDNDRLFSFSMEEFKKNGFDIVEYAEDLHSSDLHACCVTTEYEDKFKATGKNINYCKVELRVDEGWKTEKGQK